MHIHSQNRKHIPFKGCFFLRSSGLVPVQRQKNVAFFDNSTIFLGHVRSVCRLSRRLMRDHFGRRAIFNKEFPMNPQTDSAGNTYFDVLSARITCVPHTWDNGKQGVRIQAYRNPGKSDALHPGAEIPVDNQAEAFQLMKSLTLAFTQLGI